MLRLDMGQFGLSFDDETLQFWRKKLFETTLHPTKLVADSRRVFHKSPFRSPRRLVQGYSCLYLGFCLQIRSKVMTNCTDDQIKSLTRANLILRELICKTPTNRSESNDLCNLISCWFTRILVSCRQKTDLSLPRFQSCSRFLEVPLGYRVSIREFHEWNDTTLVSFSARIPTSQRGSLSTAVSTAKTKSIRIPCWWRLEL